MEEQNLTKADIDKVRHIEGFPIAKDEDIHASGYLKKGFVFQLTVKYSKILDISMQKIQSIDFGDKKSANEKP